MPLTQLAQPRWQAYFDAVSKALGSQRVKVEVTGLGIGDQVAADWIALSGLSYDPSDDTLTVFAEGLQHRISHPRTVFVDQEPDWLHSLNAVDGDGNHHIILLSEPVRVH